MRTNIYSLLLLAVIAVSSCTKDNNSTPEPINRRVIKVDGPARGLIGDSIRLQVSWPYSSGCDVFEKFATEKNGPVFSIKGWGYYYKGTCTQDAGIKKKEYVFYTAFAGTYHLNFINPDGSIIQHVLLIE